MPHSFFKVTLLALTIAACSAPHFDQKEYDSLRQAFENPPQSAKPMVWWHWMNGNITPEGLRSDILWMNRVGIGGFHVFDAALHTPQIVEKRLDYMSPEWKEAFKGAIALADSLGMEVAIASSPGWSSTGGPWVKPEDAMKKLTWRTMSLQGGKAYHAPLPEPFTVSSRFQNVPLPFEYNNHQNGPIPEWYYEDIAVYAVKLPEDYRTLEELGARVSSSGGYFDVATLTDGDLDNAGLLPAGPDGFAWIQYEFPEPQSFRAVTIVNRIARSGGHGVPATCKDSLQISSDGRNWTTLCGITQGAAQQQTEYIPGASARFWRLKHANPKARYHYGILQEPAAPASEIGEFNLLSHLPINHFEEKAGFATPCDLELYPSDPEARASEVIDITDRCKDGILDWTAPEGRWMVYRFGTSLTGKKNHPASAEATGLEVDKLDKEAFAQYLRSYLDMYKEAAGGLLGGHGIQYLLIDSYESGAQTWTPRMCEEFKARRGYDLLPWLPATAGVVIESTEATERFLWDFRRTIGELFAENFDNATRVCREEYGMKGGFYESHEHGRNCLADGISIKKSASYPMSAMWIQSTLGGSSTRRTEGMADIRESASAAHIYGQNLVAAESLTASGVNRQAYTYCPENLKSTADLELGSGVNRFVIHESSHQPVDGPKPGMGMSIYGQWFHRHETWAEQAGAWMDYLARSCAMLQQGHFVADFLYYYGEDTNVTAQLSRSELDVPFGLSYDFIGAEALLNEVRARKGKLVTRSGMSYDALCVGGQGLRMSEEVRARIDAFKKAGVRVVEDGDCRSAGAGTERDLRLDDKSGMMYVHRTTPSAEIYWIDNREGTERSVLASFRCCGRKPELWDPETGKISELSYRFVDGRTEIPLKFAPDQAYFVVFGEPVKETSFTVHEPVLCAVKEVEGPWNVAFQEGRGAPASARFNDLTDWSRSSDAGIRYFSGTAQYTATFNFEPSEGRFELDLGKVCNLAEVSINGVPLGTLWKTPFKVDVTDVLKAGTNELKISVTNLWPNRLIGDEQPGAKRIAYTTWPFYKASDPLLPSGLLGPVRILSYDVPADYSAYANPEFARKMDEVPEFANLNHCPYDVAVVPSADTPAPSGYKPFYISHYGRHGSRSSNEAADKGAQEVASILLRADAEGALTLEGKALIGELEGFVKATDGMYGRLTPLGRREHAAIAGRMFERFEPVFRNGNKRVNVLASEYPRCIISMTSFTNRLSCLDSGLMFDIDCGAKYQGFLLDHTDKRLKAGSAAVRDSVAGASNPSWDVMFARLFKDPLAARRMVDDPRRFAKNIWHAADMSGSLELGCDMYRHLPLDVRYSLAEADNIRIYLAQCNSCAFGDIRMEGVQNLVDDIVECADRAVAAATSPFEGSEPLAKAPCANLRFGHDWPLLALSSALRIEGIGERYDTAGALENFVTTYFAPFAGNLQLVFYKSGKLSDPVLVKVLLNEQEKQIIGLKAVSGPYYRWEDLREILEPKDDSFCLEAHRGVSNRYPENTIAAFSAAANLRVYSGMETDVQETSDGVLVLMHDNTIDRTVDAPGQTSWYTWKQLRKFHIDGGNGWSDVWKGKLRVPLFEEYLKICREGGLVPYVELKLLSDTGIAKTIQTLHDCGFSDEQYVLTSFTKHYLDVAKNLCNAKLEYMQTRFTAEELESLKDEGMVIRPCATKLGLATVEKCRSLGLEMECWGLPVGDAVLLRQLKEWGVKGATCNDWLDLI